MKHLLKTLTAICITMLLSCSGKNEGSKSQKTKVHDHSTIEQEDGTADMDTSPVLKNDALNAVYQHYIHLTHALTGNNANEARIAANAIEAGAKEVEGASGVSLLALKIMNASDITVQRSAYAQLSKEMEGLIKKEGLSNGELYVDFCPMALSDKGAIWISNDKEIRNPYFGKEMLGCGEIQDTIK